MFGKCPVSTIRLLFLLSSFNPQLKRLMAQIHTNQIELSVNLPQVLVLGPPSIFPIYEKHFSLKFMLLKPWESPIPLEEFLSIHSQNTTAVLTSSAVAYLSSALRLLPSVRLVVTSSVGLDHIDLKECRRRGISVAYAPSVLSADVADLAVGLWVDR
ncbi:unnamed protein product [Coffea canephora]|uniref:DH200=94 genomic scaffold, scaffold_10998 n=1 Tax=Coffea canephora TaxID=49390 RepID=A0A068VNF4_COFCA|nr:unnamed protein product [Coffea canephora]